jgi:hypothetical protein
MNTIGLNQGDWDKHFKLTADIDLSAYTGEEFNLIGNAWLGPGPPPALVIEPFTGVFDGNGHTISNLTYSATADDLYYVGLFVYTENAEIKNLGLVDPNFYVNSSVSSGVGLLAGCLRGTLANCYVEGGSVTVFNLGGAGLVYNTGLNSIITDCHTSCTVTSPDKSGSTAGLVMRNNSLLSNCHSSSAVSGNIASGLVGTNGRIISNCYATGTVSGRTAGGLVGNHYTSPDYGIDSLIINCYATGDVHGDGAAAGGFVANNKGVIVDCYASGTVSGHNRLGGLAGESFAGLWGGSEYVGSISRCYATADVSGNRILGGLVGENDGGAISDSYATGSVTSTSGWGADDTAGLVGLQDNGGSITKCYSTGHVSWGFPENGGGGFLGRNTSGTVQYSFWDTQTSGWSTSAGGTGRTTAQMQTRSTFTLAGWDFTDETANGTEDIWRLCVDLTSYPILAWQRWPLGDYYCPDGSDFKDYAVLAGQWQQAPGEPSADIAPEIRDGIVSGPDLRKLCDNWLAE